MSSTTSFISRHSTLVYSLAGVCMLCIFLLPYGKRIYDQTPRYEWESGNMGKVKSDEPFGARYLDEYLHEYWKDKVYVTEDVDSAFSKYGKQRANYIFLNSCKDDSLHIARYISRANTGDRFLIAGTSTGIIESLIIKVRNKEGVWEGNEFNINDFINSPDERRRKLQLSPYNNKNPKYIRIWDKMIPWTMQSAVEQDSLLVQDEDYFCNFLSCYGDIGIGTYSSLLTLGNNQDVAARRDIGNGCITFSFSFALFSNYAVQDKDLRIGMEHIMEQTFNKSLPLVIVYSGDDAQPENEEFYISMYEVLLRNPASALFLWLLTAALILAIVVNGRRRRRAEDVRRKSYNSSISFIQHLATLYSAGTNYTELLCIEKRVLLYRLRKEYYFDMRTRNFTKISQFAEHVANTKGLSREQVAEVLSTLEELTAPGVHVEAESYRLCINQVDEVLGSYLAAPATTTSTKTKTKTKTK